MPAPSLSRSLLQTLASLAIALGLLWWLQSILVPIAMAVLLTFLLSPPVSWMQRRGLPRALSVVVMLAGTVLLVGSIAWTVSLQVGRLVDTFPDYQQHLNAKIAGVHSRSEHGFFDKLQVIVGQLSRQLDQNTGTPSRQAAGKRAEGGAPAPAPQPVTIVENAGPFHIASALHAIAPLLEPLATASLTVVLTIFMLLRREDLRDRVLALMGQARLVAATRAFDDAGTRISRYLLRQLMVNGGFGLALAIGLTLIGVPYGVLWGALAALLRYVPYLGTWLAALVPIALSLVITDGWQPVWLVVALFLSLELVTNMIVEPRVYSQGVGVSETATLVMVAFWTWLWGPAGLILATPLTVCVVVLGEHVPSLRYFNMLLGDRPALPQDISFYQRLLANDVHEATRIAGQLVETTSHAHALDQLMRPAIGHVCRDVNQGQLTEEEEQVALKACLEVLASLPVPTPASAPSEAAALAARPTVMVIATRDAASAAAARVFEQMLKGRCGRFGVDVLPPGLLVSEVGQRIADAPPFAVVIAAVAGDTLSQVRHLCLRVQKVNPDLPIIVGLWTPSSETSEALADGMLAAGADGIAGTFAETRAQLESLRQLLPA